ncbi:MAG: hypothetical protein H5T86_03305 [Armatimonadetes bacterium]|nr:hypothetical protein [Armatimonadota bacterium]
MVGCVYAAVMVCAPDPSRRSPQPATEFTPVLHNLTRTTLDKRHSLRLAVETRSRDRSGLDREKHLARHIRFILERSKREGEAIRAWRQPNIAVEFRVPRRLHQQT